MYEDAEASKRVSTDIYDYGFQSAVADKTFYIKNDGADSRTYNFIVPAGYSADASLEVAAGQVEPFTVTQTYGEGDYGFKEGTLTVSSADMDDVSISIKGIARDPEKIYLDFETEPEGWTVEEGWTINEGVATADYNNKSIFSPMVEVKEGDKLYLKYNFNSTYGELTIKYSTDNSAFTQVTKITPDQRDVWGDVVVDVAAAEFPVHDELAGGDGRCAAQRLAPVVSRHALRQPVFSHHALPLSLRHLVLAKPVVLRQGHLVLRLTVITSLFRSRASHGKRARRDVNHLHLRTAGKRQSGYLPLLRFLGQCVVRNARGALRATALGRRAPRVVRLGRERAQFV